MARGPGGGDGGGGGRGGRGGRGGQPTGARRGAPSPGAAVTRGRGQGRGQGRVRRRGPRLPHPGGGARGGCGSSQKRGVSSAWGSFVTVWETNGPVARRGAARLVHLLPIRCVSGHRRAAPPSSGSFVTVRAGDHTAGGFPTPGDSRRRWVLDAGAPPPPGTWPARAAPASGKGERQGPEASAGSEGKRRWRITPGFATPRVHAPTLPHPSGRCHGERGGREDPGPTGEGPSHRSTCAGEGPTPRSTHAGHRPPARARRAPDSSRRPAPPALTRPTPGDQATPDTSDFCTWIPRRASPSR
jgi:hypothetical protein